MRLKHIVQVQLTQDSAGRRRLYSDDATPATTDTSGFGRQANSLLSVEAGAIESLSFGDVTVVRGLYLEVSVEAKVRLNGSADAIQLRKAPDAAMAKLFVEGEITQVTVENPTGDTTLTGVYVVWGDPTA